ncbi:ABC transporter permease [Streptomyces sp. NPDC048664]|uniref:ABC transporter permease n=1 Tax=Streptomyces sp. NPDC048664 TaxID=3154505 RepID=UPI0034123CBE
MPRLPAAPAAPTRSPVPEVRHGRRVVAIVVLIPALVALALWSFAWPAARTAPHHLPLGVAGPPAAAAQAEQGLTRHEGAFEIHRYADEAAARDAIEHRTVYGAVVVTARGPELLTASAAGPVVAQALQQAVTRQAASEGSPVRVRTVDVVAAPPTDPRGSALAASVLPMAMVGIGAGAAVTLLGLRGRRAVTALVGASALVGVVAAAIADSWLGVVTGDWWVETGALGLSTLAVGAAVAGVAALAGQRGVALVSLVVMLLGNPFSGAASAPQMLPEPVGTIGQWLPPGAGASLLRSVAFFDGAAASGPALTLAWWAVIGLGLVLLGSTLPRRRPADTPRPADAERAPALAG